MVRDPMLDTAYSDLEQLRDSLQQAQERIFDVGLYLTIYGSTREEIDKTETEVRSVLESRLVYIRPALFQQEQGFRSLQNIDKNIHSDIDNSIALMHNLLFANTPGNKKISLITLMVIVPIIFPVKFS